MIKHDSTITIRIPNTDKQIALSTNAILAMKAEFT